MSFNDMKKRSGTTDFLKTKLEEMNDTKKSYKDDRFWRPELDSASNGFAIIRFLPATEGAELPWVRVWNHGFQGPGGWYIENSLTTIGQKDPVSELNSKLWNSGTEQGKEIARKQKRRLTYIANIMVVSDPKNPDNEGKVFLYKFGKKIFDKIMESMNPEFEDETPVNPFDYWTGANFRLKVRKDELKERLQTVLGDGDTTIATSAESVEVDTSIAPAESETPVTTSTSNSDSDDEGDDALSYFERLASED